MSSTNMRGHHQARKWLLAGMTAAALAFLVGSVIQTRQMAHDFVNRAAAREARLADAFQHALRSYVGDSIRPEMAQCLPEGEFIPEAMSTSFVARSVFDKVRKDFPDLVTRFVTDNPRNPINQATPAEHELLDHFEQHPEATRRANAYDLIRAARVTKRSANRMEAAGSCAVRRPLPHGRGSLERQMRLP
jgi:heme exporter protein D